MKSGSLCRQYWCRQYQWAVCFLGASPELASKMRKTSEFFGVLFQVNANNQRIIIMRTSVETYRVFEREMQRAAWYEVVCLLGEVFVRCSGLLLSTGPGLFSPHFHLSCLLFCAAQLSFQRLKNVPHLLWWMNRLLRTRGKTHCIHHGAGSPGKPAVQEGCKNKNWKPEQS